MLLCFWVSPSLSYCISYLWNTWVSPTGYVSKAKGLYLNTPFGPLGWEAVDGAEPLSLWIPFYPGLWKSRILRWEDQGKCRRHHVQQLTPGLLWSCKTHCKSLSNRFSSKPIFLSFYRIIKQTSKMTTVLLGPFPMAAKHLPSIAPPPLQHTVRFIVVEAGYLEVSRLTGCLDFLKLCLSLNVAKWIVYKSLHEPGLHTKSCTQCCYFCFRAPFPLDVGISAFRGGSLEVHKTQ